MNQNGIDLQVCVDGRPIREYGLEGRTIVEGRKGVPFTIKVRNNHPTKVHVSVLVDGVGVVSGNEKDLRGYILEAYSSYEVKGWRRSLNDVAQFIFETKDGSYSKIVKGSDAQCGVISVIAHAEKTRPPAPQVIEKHVHHDHHHYHDDWYDPWYVRPYRPWRYPTIIYSSTVGGTSGTVGNAGACGGSGGSCTGSNAVDSASLMRSMSFTSTGPKGEVGPSGPPGEPVACYHMSMDHGGGAGASFSASVSMNGEVQSLNAMNLGTGWGAQQTDSVVEVAWENGTKLATMELYYTDAKGLKKLGIDVNKAPALAKTAGFPTGLTGTGFCQPPTLTYAGDPPIPPAPQKPTVKTRKKTASKR